MMQINVNNKVVEYYKFGEGKKNLIIIPGIGIHSAVAMGAFVEKAFEVFKKDYTVYLIERANVLNKVETVDSIANDYIKIFDDLNLKDLYIYGASFGGMLCQAIVHSKPELVRKMAIASTISGRADSKKVISLWSKLIEENNVEGLIVQVLKDTCSKKVFDQLKDVMIKDCKNLTVDDVKRFDTQLNAILNFDSTDYLAEINCPTFIIAAKGDKLFNYHESEYLNSKIKDSELLLYGEDMPHDVYDEAGDVPEKLFNFFEK